MLYGRHLGETQPNVSRDESARLTLDFSRSFNERNRATAALMQADQARAFLKMIEEDPSMHRFKTREGFEPSTFRL